MSEEKKRQDTQKGGAHIAKPGSKISISAEHTAKWKEDSAAAQPTPLSELSLEQSIAKSVTQSLEQAKEPNENPANPVRTAQEPATVKKREKSPLMEVRAVLNVRQPPSAPAAASSPASDNLSGTAAHSAPPGTGPVKTAPKPDDPQKRNKYANRLKKKEKKPVQSKPAAPLQSQAAEQEKQEKDKTGTPKTKPEKKAKSGKAGLAAAVVAIALVGCGGAYWVWQSQSQQSAAPGTNETAVVMRGTLETYVEGTGVTAANKREELGREMKGKVTEVLVEVGDQVKQGDKLLVINPTETRQELAVTQQELSNAQSSAAAIQQEVQAAQNEVAAVRTKMGNLSVSAPFTGKLVAADNSNSGAAYTVGQKVKEGDIIGYMVDDSTMNLSLYYDAKYADSIYEGQTANVSVASGTVSGTVSAVDKTSSGGTDLIRVTIAVRNEGSLTKGMTATATIEAGDLGSISDTPVTDTPVTDTPEPPATDTPEPPATDTPPVTDTPDTPATDTPPVTDTPADTPPDSTGDTPAGTGDTTGNNTGDSSVPVNGDENKHTDNSSDTGNASPAGDHPPAEPAATGTDTLGNALFKVSRISRSNTGGGEIHPADSGTLEYNREVAVKAPESGQIKTAAGGLDNASYTSGATIITMTSDDLQDDLRIAESRVKTAQSKIVSAQRQVQAKQAKITELQKIIADATLKSPIDGVIVSLNAEPGQDVTGADALVTVADLTDIIVNADVASADVSFVQAGQLANMTVYLNDGELNLSGVVKSVALEPKEEADQNGLSVFPAVIALDPIEGQVMSVGQSVDYQITTAIAENTLMAPSSAIVNTEDGTAVFALPAEGQTFDDARPIPPGTEGVPPSFVLVPVETGISDGVNTEILWGVDEGTTVYQMVQDARTGA